jgi:hypothetical protein
MLFGPRKQFALATSALALAAGAAFGTNTGVTAALAGQAMVEDWQRAACRPSSLSACAEPALPEQHRKVTQCGPGLPPCPGN